MGSMHYTHLVLDCGAAADLAGCAKQKRFHGPFDTPAFPRYSMIGWRGARKSPSNSSIRFPESHINGEERGLIKPAGLALEKLRGGGAYGSEDLINRAVNLAGES